ncbi:MAG: Ig-like domain-containing protein [Candidatus Hydrogenedentes bacterium]|nr:Ig-like domain-containing protein [Candidatus Hydrogenedentota bacterium]
MKKQTERIRILTLSMCLVLMVFFTGCPSGDTPPVTNPPVDENPPPDGGTPVSVSVAPARAVLGVGQVLKLEAKSDGAKKEDYVWSSSNPSVASVDQSGTVRGVSGSSSEVTITATGNKSKKGGKSRVIIAQVSVSSTGAPLAIGGTEKLTASSTYSGDTSFEWASSNSGVVSVAANGTVTAASAGTATITATGSVSRASGSKEVTVAKVTVSYSGEPLSVGWSEQFNVSSTYAGDTSFSWESSNPGVASVSANGTVTAQALGSATITATGNGSGFSGSQQVTVVPENDSMLIWDGEVAYSGEYGSLSTADPFRGTACYEGTPDQWHTPTLILSGVSSYRADISGYDEIWFFAKANQAGKSFGLAVCGWPNWSNYVSIDPYIQGGALDTTWRLVRIPIASLKTASYTLNSIETLSFGLAVPTGGHKFYVDEIWAVDLDTVNPDNTPLTGQLKSLYFGDVALNTSAQLTVPVSNIGVANLEVSGVTIANDARGEFSVDSGSFVVAPGASHTITVTLTPTVPGAKNATLQIAHNLTPLGAVSKASLIAAGVGPRIAVSPSSLSFGSVAQGQQASLPLTVKNTGNADLHVSSIQSSNGAFSVPAGALTIAPSGQQVVNVTFAPAQAVSYNAQLTLNSDDPLIPQRTLSVGGTGLASGSAANLNLHVSSTTSSQVALCWPLLQNASQTRVYVGPEPSSSGTGSLPMQKLVATLSGSQQEYTVQDLAPAVDAFFYVQTLNASSQTIGECHTHVRTPGGPRAALDTAVREVHMVAPNVLEVVMADFMVHSFSSMSDTYDQGVNEIVGDHGLQWQTGTWTVIRQSGAPIPVVNVYRHSVPVGQNYYEVAYQGSTADNLLDVDHRIFLVLGSPVGSRDVLSVLGPLDTNIVVPFSDQYLETPVIQVNQVGYSPRATERYAYVSGWMGSGGPLDLSGFPAQAKVLIDHANPLTPRTVALSNLPLNDRTAAGQVDGDSGTPVKDIDLSSLPAAEGMVYRVQIPGVGVSWPTQVSEAAVQKAFYTVARGLYHNRWGRDLKPQWTEFSSRPSDHPTVFTAELDDPTQFHSQDTPHVGERPLVGGHHDAGDFDIRLFHYVTGLLLMRAFEVNPDAFTDGQLTIPESGNGIPDLLDEALWSLAAWEQLQEADGGVRMGVESYRHPWGFYYADEEPLPYWTYAREPVHTIRVAGLFAQASRLVAPYDADKAAELEARAKAAYAYALANGAGLHNAGPTMYAAGELSELTGISEYETMFESTWQAFDQWGNGPDIFPLPAWFNSHLVNDWQPILTDFVMGYVESPQANPTYRSQTYTQLQTHAQAVIDRIATQYAHRNARSVGAKPDWGATTTMGYYLSPLYAMLQTGALSPQAQQAYINAISLCADYQMGCNPLGMVWVTGLGSRHPEDPLHLDTLSFLKDGYGLMPGIPVYGPVEQLNKVEYVQYAERLFYPALPNTPILMRYGDCHGLAQMSEFDIGLQVRNAQLFGILMAPGFQPPASWLPFGSEHLNPLPPRQQ